MSRLEVPKFKGPMSPSAIIQWLDWVSDSFDAFITFNSDKKLTPALQILYAGLAMEDTALAWWSENRTKLWSLEKWENFTAHILACFAPDGWKANMLCIYYFIQQQSRPYSIFATELQSTHSTIGCHWYHRSSWDH